MPFIALILGFGFIIFVHELGHFLVAKWVGIHVTQFAVGFGQAVVCYRKGIGLRRGTTEPEYQKRLDEGADPKTLGETEYRLNWLPLGGYVKMVGQDDLDPSAQSTTDERAYSNKPIWARSAVISAGVIMNLITGMIFFVIAFSIGVNFPPAEVGDVLVGSPASKGLPLGVTDTAGMPTGLQPGDEITHVNGEPITDFMDLAVRVHLTRRGDSVELTVNRPGHDKPLIFSMVPEQISRRSPLLSLGIAPPSSLDIATFNTAKDAAGNMPAAAVNAGVKSEMRATAVNGKPIERYHEYLAALREAKGKPVTVTFKDLKTDQTVDAPISAVPGLAVDLEHLYNMSQATSPHPQIAGLLPAVRVQSVEADMPASEIGLEAGDIIMDVAGTAWPDQLDLPKAIQQMDDQPITLKVLRAGQTVTLKPAKPRDGRLGFGYQIAKLPIIARSLPDTPAAEAALPNGSRIVKLNDTPIESMAALQRTLEELAARESPLEPINVAFVPTEVGGDPRTTTLTFDDETVKQLGRATWQDPMPFAARQEPLVGESIGDATRLGFVKTKQFMLQTYVTIARLFQGTVPPSELRGPVGIVHTGTQVASRGPSYLMFFLGLISVNLVVINFLPIPVVDGGQMVFLIIEKIKGSPVSVRVQNVATMAGLALIGSVFLVTLYFDIGRLVAGN